ncbi:MAG: hypothetical protein ABIF19_01250 [Planctomycetota bacterium]
MSVKKVLKTEYLHMLWAALIFALMLLVMMALECRMATPAY